MLRRLRMVLAAMLALCAVAAGGLFTLQNTGAVPLDLLFIQLPPMPLSLWLLLSLTCGVLVGLIGGSLLLWRLRARLLITRHERDKLAVEVDRLRRAGITAGE